MIGKTLKDEIDLYIQKTVESHPFFVQAQKGTFTRDQLILFLENVTWLVEHTPVHLDLATTVSQEQRKVSLTHFFRQKCEEEVGHDAWGRNDLKKLNTHSPSRRLKTMKQLIEANEAVIRQTPELYLSYILFSEYFTSQTGRLWTKLLAEHCQIQNLSTSMVDNHAELDKEHVIDDISAIDTLVPNEKANAIIDALRIAMNHHSAFLLEVAQYDSESALRH